MAAVRTDVQTVDANSEELACIAYCTAIVLVMKATGHVETHARIVTQCIREGDDFDIDSQQGNLQNLVPSEGLGRNGGGCRHVADIGETFKFIARLVAIKTVERLFNFINPSTMGLLIGSFFLNKETVW